MGRRVIIHPAVAGTGLLPGIRESGQDLLGIMIEILCNRVAVEGIFHQDVRLFHPDEDPYPHDYVDHHLLVIQQGPGLHMMVATWCQQDLQITGRKDTHPRLSFIDLHPETDTTMHSILDPLWVVTLQ